MHRHSPIVRLAMFAALGVLPGTALAQIPGGGPAKADWYVEWRGITPNKGKNLDCQDGDPTCDVDTTQNGVCVLGVGVCVAQTNVPGCASQQIDKVTVMAKPKTVKLGSVKIPVPPPAPPLTPVTAPTCAAESIIRASRGIGGLQGPSMGALTTFPGYGPYRLAAHRFVYRPQDPVSFAEPVERRSMGQHVARLVAAGRVAEVEPGRFRVRD